MKSRHDVKNRFHHIGIVVKDISQAIQKYSVILGINRNDITTEVGSYITEEGEIEEFKYAFLPFTEEEINFIELVEPITSGPTARYLKKYGEGLFHLAFESFNILDTIGEFKTLGIPRAGINPAEEPISAFFNPKYSHGVLIQVIRKDAFTKKDT